MKSMIGKNNIINYYRDRLTNKESLRYLTIHAKRYAFLLKKMAEIRNTIRDDKIDIMDIGPSYLTEQIQNAFPNDTVYSLGYSHTESRGGHFPGGVKVNEKRIIHFDLNNVQHKDKWISVPICQIVILAEVIEHLYTAPNLILNFIRTFLNNDGTLIIQTPNAVSLFNRIKMICGENPFEMIRENNQNPGHFREYTKKELFSLAEKSNYKVIYFIYSNYFDLQPVTYKTMGYRLLQFILGKSLKDGMTIILKKIE